MSRKTITFQQFLDGYKKGELTVLVNKNRAGDFVLSKFGDKYNKPAHLFWTWLGITMVVPLPLILWIFCGWKFALASFILGLVVCSASRKTAGQFVLKNMLEDEVFCSYALLHDGASIEDKEGNEIFLEMVEKAEFMRMMKVSRKEKS